MWKKSMDGKNETDLQTTTIVNPGFESQVCFATSAGDEKQIAINPYITY